MQPHNHVREAVAAHRFLDPADWAAALSELADMTDEQIDAIAASDAEAKVSKALNVARKGRVVR